MEKKAVTLQDFLNKVEESKVKKVKITQIEVADFGLMEFIRPREGVLLDYLNEVVKAIDKTTEKTYEEEKKDDLEILETEDNSKKDINLKTEKSNEKIDMKLLVKASGKLVYSSCPLMRAKEVREQFKGIEPYDIPIELLGINKVMDLAQKLSDIFDGIKTQKTVNEAVKN